MKKSKIEISEKNTLYDLFAIAFLLVLFNYALRKI